MNSGHSLEVKLHGPLRVQWADGSPVPGLGAKQMALIALVCCAPDMVRTRSWLTATLWGRSDQKLGRSSLRQALNVIRTKIGPAYDEIFVVDRDRVGLNPDAVRLVGGVGDGQFLEGLDINEEGFEDWLREQRAEPATVIAYARRPENSAVDIQPRAAVLPFGCFGLPDQYVGIGDFIAQELIRSLSRSQLVDVISHLSSRVVGAETIDIRDIRTRLGVDYVATGTIHFVAGRLLVHVDFNDCDRGTHLWDGRFSIPEAALFENNEGVIGEITGDILSSILRASTDGGRMPSLPSVATHRLLMSAISLMYNVDRRQFATAKDRIDEVISRAQTHSIPQAWAAQWHLLKIFQGWSDDPTADRKTAEGHILRGLDFNPSCALTLAMDGNVKTVLNADFEAASQSFASALKVNPSSAVTCSFNSVLLSFLGRGQDAVALAERGMFLSPCDPRRHFFDALVTSSYLVAGDYARAIELAEAAIRSSPGHVSPLRAKIVGLSLAGRTEDARASAKDLMRLAPDTNVTDYLAHHPARQTGVAQLWAEALEMAGVPRR